MLQDDILNGNRREVQPMPVKLSTTAKKIDLVSNRMNRDLLREFFQYTQSNGSSESHQNNNLKVMVSFARSLAPSITFFDIKESDLITRFLDSKLKSANDDPDRKSIVTWNDYLGRIKYFFRWIQNNRAKDALVDQSEWITPPFASIRKTIQS
jgi:integrase/recombinase XerD